MPDSIGLHSHQMGGMARGGLYSLAYWVCKADGLYTIVLCLMRDCGMRARMMAHCRQVYAPRG